MINKLRAAAVLSSFLFLLFGVAAALLFSFFWRSVNDPWQHRQAADSATHGSQTLDQRIAQLEALILTLGIQIRQLQDLVDNEHQPTSDRVSGLGQQTSEGIRVSTEENFAGEHAHSANSPAPMIEQLGQIDRILNPPSLAALLVEKANLSSEQAQRFAERLDELTVEATEDRLRKGTRSTPYDAYSTQHRYVERRLQDEFGDLIYEGYRVAAGLSTDVLISAVEEGSIAQRAGLQPGDIVVSYGGRRVMELGALEELINENESRSPAAIEVNRNGQRLHLQVPNGPLGVTELNHGERLRRQLTGK